MDGDIKTPQPIIIADPLITGIDATQSVAQQGGVSIPVVNVPTGPRLVSSQSLPWHHGMNWKHGAIILGVVLVVWWILSGEDPVETVANVAKEGAKVVT